MQTQEKILLALQEIKKHLQLQKQVLTLDEFCTYAGISKHQAYYLTSTGKIKFYRPFGKMIYLDASEVIDFLKSNPVQSTENKNKKAIHSLLK